MMMLSPVGVEGRSDPTAVSQVGVDEVLTGDKGNSELPERIYLTKTNPNDTKLSLRLVPSAAATVSGG